MPKWNTHHHEMLYSLRNCQAISSQSLPIYIYISLRGWTLTLEHVGVRDNKDILLLTFSTCTPLVELPTSLMCFVFFVNYFYGENTPPRGQIPLTQGSTSGQLRHSFWIADRLCYFPAIVSFLWNTLEHFFPTYSQINSVPSLHQKVRGHTVF